MVQMMTVSWIEQTNIENGDISLAIESYLNDPETFKGEIFHLILSDEDELHIAIFNKLQTSIKEFLDSYNYDTTDFFTYQNDIGSLYSKFSVNDEKLKDLIKQFDDNELIEDLITLMLTHQIAIKSFELKQYSKMIERLCYSQSLLTGMIYTYGAWRIDVDKVKSFIQSENAQKGWKPHNEQRKQLKERYLTIMRQGKFTSVTSATDHIHANENPEKKKYRWIYDRLTEATKGNFD